MHWGQVPLSLGPMGWGCPHPSSLACATVLGEDRGDDNFKISQVLPGLIYEGYPWCHSVTCLPGVSLSPAVTRTGCHGNRSSDAHEASPSPAIPAKQEATRCSSWGDALASSSCEWSEGSRARGPQRVKIPTPPWGTAGATVPECFAAARS